MKYTRSEILTAYTATQEEDTDINAAYNTFQIKKGRSNKLRTISAPLPWLRDIQRSILENYLYPDYLKYCHPAAVGFMPGVSIADAVAPHIGAHTILEFDIKDFFWNITTAMTINALGEHWEPSLGELSPHKIVKFCMKDRILPQGAPTSPMLSNLVMHPFDTVFGRQITAAKDVTYTRYADNIIISASRDLDSDYWWNLIQCDLNASFRHHLVLKKSKKSQYWQRQKVLGLVLNEKVSIPRKLRRNLRAALYQYGKHQVSPLPAPMRGMLSYIKSVNRDQFDALAWCYVSALSNHKAVGSDREAIAKQVLHSNISFGKQHPDLSEEKYLTDMEPHATLGTIEELSTSKP